MLSRCHFELAAVSAHDGTHLKTRAGFMIRALLTGEAKTNKPHGHSPPRHPGNQAESLFMQLEAMAMMAETNTEINEQIKVRLGGLRGLGPTSRSDAREQSVCLSV